jgi:hypothetical protein
MEHDKKAIEQKNDHDEEDLRRKNREKCSACPKGDMCMIDWDRRIMCRAPEKK